MAIPANAPHPRLAHEFLNFFLDKKWGYENFADWNGYQPPFTSIDPERWSRTAWCRRRSRLAVVAEEDFTQGYMQSELTPEADDDLARRLERDPRRWLASRRSRGASEHVRERIRLAIEADGRRYPRWYWPSFTAPGLVWLASLFILPFYVVISVAFGTVDPFFRSPLPVYQPWWWSFDTFSATLQKFGSGGCYLPSPLIRTLAYVVAASLICLVIGYAVAYYTARFAGKRTGADPDPADRAVLDQLPDADLRVAEPAPAGRLHQRLPDGPATSAPVELARRQAHHRDPRAGVRLHPVHDPAAVRLAGPHQPEPAGGGTRPGRRARSRRSDASRCRCRSPRSSRGW